LESEVIDRCCSTNRSNVYEWSTWIPEVHYTMTPTNSHVFK
jgi:hypothetical protein